MSVLQGFRGLQGFGGEGGLGEGAQATLASVVLFPPESLRFGRRRADKTLYSWAVFMRDMRAPTAGFRPGRDHLVSAVRLAAR